MDVQSVQNISSRFIDLQDNIDAALQWRHNEHDGVSNH